MYYSVGMAESPGKHCVAAAFVPNAEGSFASGDVPLFCDLGVGGAINVDGFNNLVTHKQYIIYKVDGNSIGKGGACSNSVQPIAPTPLVMQEVSPDDGYSFIGGPLTITPSGPQFRGRIRWVCQGQRQRPGYPQYR